MPPASNRTGLKKHAEKLQTIMAGAHRLEMCAEALLYMLTVMWLLGPFIAPFWLIKLVGWVVSNSKFAARRVEDLFSSPLFANTLVGFEMDELQRSLHRVSAHPNVVEARAQNAIVFTWFILIISALATPIHAVQSRLVSCSKACNCRCARCACRRWCRSWREDEEDKLIREAEEEDAEFNQNKEKKENKDMIEAREEDELRDADRTFDNDGNSTYKDTYRKYAFQYRTCERSWVFPSDLDARVDPEEWEKWSRRVKLYTTVRHARRCFVLRLMHCEASDIPASDVDKTWILSLAFSRTELPRIFLHSLVALVVYVSFRFLSAVAAIVSLECPEQPCRVRRRFLPRHPLRTPGRLPKITPPRRRCWC